MTIEDETGHRIDAHGMGAGIALGHRLTPRVAAQVVPKQLSIQAHLASDFHQYTALADIAAFREISGKQGLHQGRGIAPLLGEKNGAMGIEGIWGSSDPFEGKGNAVSQPFLDNALGNETDPIRAAELPGEVGLAVHAAGRHAGVKQEGHPRDLQGIQARPMLRRQGQGTVKPALADKAPGADHVHIDIQLNDRVSGAGKKPRKVLLRLSSYFGKFQQGRTCSCQAAGAPMTRSMNDLMAKSLPLETNGRPETPIGNLNELLRHHIDFLEGRVGGMRANICHANMSGLNLNHVVLRNAGAAGANFSRSLLIGADISYADLFRVDFQYSNLTKANLFRADLKGARLRGAKLTEANLNEADLRAGAYLETGFGDQPTDLTYARLDRATLRDTNLTQARLNNASMIAADLHGATLYDTDLSDVNLADANLAMAKLKGVNLAGANLSGANFAGAILLDCNLKGARLTGTKLSEARMTNVDLSETIMARNKESLPLDIQEILQLHQAWIDSNGAKGKRAELTGADLSEVNLAGSNFNGAHLKMVDMRGAILTNCTFLLADLSGSDLSYANLVLTDLMGANLTGVNLTRSRLSRANLGPATIWRPDGQHGTRMWSVNLSNANLTFADLSDANLKEADLTNADLRGADLTDADLEEAILLNTNIQDTIIDPNMSLNHVKDVLTEKPAP